MPEVDYAVLSEWFDWITTNISIPVDLIGENTQSRKTNTHLIHILIKIRNTVVVFVVTHRNLHVNTKQ